MMMHCTFEWDWVRFDKNEKDFLPIFPDFFHVWKIARKISRLFQEFKTLYKPWELTLKSSTKLINWNALIILLFSTFVDLYGP